MYTMMIADEDMEYIRQIEECVKTSCKDINVIATTNVGLEVLNEAKKNRIDILVISVKLNGILGIEVVRQLKKKSFDGYIVVLSAYDMTDFMRECIACRVDNYFLKPINLSVFKDAINEIVDELKNDERKKARTRLLEYKENQICEFVDYSFIYTFLWNCNGEAKVKDYRELLNLTKSGFVLNLEIRDIGSGCVINIEKDYSIVYQAIKDIIVPKYKCVVGPLINNRIVIYVALSDEEVEAQKESLCDLRLANELRFELKKCLDIGVRVGIGGIRRLEEIHYSYEEAIKSLRYMEESDVVSIQEVKSKSISHEDYIELENKLLQSVRLGKDDGFDMFTKMAELLCELNIQERKNKLIELLSIVCREARLQGENEVDNMDYCAYAEQMKYMSWEDMKRWMYNKLEYVLKSVRSSRSARKSDVVKDAMAYVRDNYTQDLPLDVISNQVGVTPQHFSKLFKEETGYNYVEWLTHLRMEKAKEYLLEGKRTIKEVGYLIGINDSNYFSRVFKKSEGISPTEFLKQNKADQQ